MNWIFPLMSAIVALRSSRLVTCSPLQRPNIVFILADDLGWNDVGFHGSDQIPTPNLDALAYDGVILSNYYVQPLCTPTRAALMTGRYPIRVGLQHYVLYSAQPFGLLLNQTIMPQYLKTLGYDAHIVGKWHLGFFAREYLPTHRGFDSHLGYYQGRGDYWDHTNPGDGYDQKAWGLDFHENEDVVRTAFGQYSTELFSQRAEEIISRHDLSKPLYLYMAHQAVHSGNMVNPLQAPWKYVEKMSHIKDPSRRLYAANLAVLDDSVGNLTKALFNRGMLNNTIIIFSSDNGGAANGFDMNDANNWPLRGLKATLWEGGVRGTGFIWSPLLEKSGYTSKHLLHVTDWLPTLLHAAGFDTSRLPKDLDGINQWDAISRNTDSKRTEIMLNIDPVENSSAIRSDDMKLVSAKSGFTRQYDGWLPLDQTSKIFHKSDSNHVNPSLYQSDIHHLFEKIGRQSERSDVRTPLVVSCGPVPPEALTNCKPWLKPCLYNITADPCEFYNLADSRKELVEALEETLKRYEKASMPPHNTTVDDAGLPYRHDGAWVPWRTLADSV